VTFAEPQQIVTPECPDDEPAHEAGGQRGEQDGHDHAEIQVAVVAGAVSAPGEAYHATPDRRRQTIPPINSAKAAIGSMTNAAVKSVILSRMASGPPTPSFRKGCAGPTPTESALSIMRLRDDSEIAGRAVGEDLFGAVE